MISVEIEKLNEQIQNAQKKIEELQQNEKEEKIELYRKETTIEPNMKVFSKWLKSIDVKKKEYELRIQNRERIIEKSTHGGVLYAQPEVVAMKLEKYHKEMSDLVTQEKKEKISSQNVEVFQSNKYPHMPMPTEFMIQFIEATHNLFKLQQIRIEELERKLLRVEEDCHPHVRFKK
mgnify:CR=1 FL=1|tara:strand:+ start:1481 stop:2008 length:528 start_codon:yes stop_codon:yes gene_type:complete